MAIHIIPETEPELHEETENCVCDPEFKLDEESGEMVWLHNFIDLERLIDDILNLNGH